MLLMVAALAACQQATEPYETAVPETPLFPGATQPDTKVVHTAGVTVEYPEDWLQGAGDIGPPHRSMVSLQSPAGSMVFVYPETMEIEVLDEQPEDAEEIDFLLTEGIRFATPAPAD